MLARLRHPECLPEHRPPVPTLSPHEQKLSPGPGIVCLDTPCVNAAAALAQKASQQSEHPLPLSKMPWMGSWHPDNEGRKILKIATATELLASHFSPRPAFSHPCHLLARTRNSAFWPSARKYASRSYVSRSGAACSVFLELQQPCFPAPARCSVEPFASPLLKVCHADLGDIQALMLADIGVRKAKEALPVGIALCSGGAVQDLSVHVCPNSGIQVSDSTL